MYTSLPLPSKLVRSDSHLIWIGWEALARCRLDGSCVLVCFWTGCFTFGQNLTQSARTKLVLGWFCTVWSGLSVQEHKQVWKWEIGSCPVVFCRNWAWWFSHISLLLDWICWAKTWPRHPDGIWTGFAQDDQVLLWINGAKLDTGSQIPHKWSGPILATRWP